MFLRVLNISYSLLPSNVIVISLPGGWSLGVGHSLTPMCKTTPQGGNTTVILENVEHCGGEPEQAANRFDIGFVTSKIVCQVFTRDS